MRPESSEPIAPNSPLFVCVRKFTLVTIKRNNMLSPFKKKCDTNGGGEKCAGKFDWRFFASILIDKVLENLISV